MSNNDDSILATLLTKNRTRLNYQPSDKQQNKEQATTAGENLFSDFAPETRGGRGNHSLGSNWRRFPLYVTATLVSGLLTVLVIIGRRRFGIQLYSIPEITFPVLGSVSWLEEAIIFGVIVTIAFLTVYLYLLTRQLITYDKTGSLVLSTAGDGTVQASFTGAGIFNGRFEHVLASFGGHATIPQEECSYGDLLEVTDANGAIPEEYEPYVATVRFYAAQPFDALGVGRTTEELLADYNRNSDDANFPTDGIAGALANSDIPAAVQCTFGARPKDSGRTTVVENRIEGMKVASKADATWRDDETGAVSLARVLDVNVRVLAFERPGAETTVEQLCNEITSAIEGPTNDGVSSVTYRLVSADENFFENPRLAALWANPDTVLTRFDADTVVYKRAHLLRGRLTVAGLRARTNLPQTPAEVWRYLLPVGDGLTDSKRAHGAQRRDQTPTGRPPEHAQDHFRAGDGRLSQERDTQASDTPRDEHT